MPYLNLDPNYFDHHKTKRLVTILGPHTDVLPLRLWAYCAKFHALDGRLRGYSAEEVESIVGWCGTKNAAIAALAKVGFISANPGGYACVDWLEHQGHLRMFSRRAKAAARARWGHSKSNHATSMHKHESSSAPSVPIRTNKQQITTGSPSAVESLVRKTAAKAGHIPIRFDTYRLPKGFGKYGSIHVVNIPADECQFLLDKMKPGPQVRAALEWRINLKKSESNGVSR